MCRNRGLRLKEPSVDAAVSQQLVMRTPLHSPTALDDKDPVGVKNMVDSRWDLYHEFVDVSLECRTQPLGRVRVWYSRGWCR